MKCPNCQGHIGAFALLRKGSAKQTCPKCRSPIRVTGLTAFLVTPMIALFFIPVFAWLDDPGLIMIIGACVVVALYVLSFVLFVEVERDQTGPGENGRGASDASG
jgi:ABC-type protease/lipase transport system fused ATPase/permease subunit